MASTGRVKTKLSAASSALDDLEEKLAPLLAQSLPESILSLDTIQQAKLQTLVPYLVYDLIFIYLKSRGIDPKTHAVLPELDRVREYFGKITTAETNEKQRFGLDKDAAKRFIIHAVTQSKHTKQASAFVYDNDAQNYTDGVNTMEGPAPAKNSNVVVPVKVTSKMIARAQYDKELRELDEENEEEDVLEMFDENGEPQGEDIDMEQSVPSAKAKGKGKAVDESSVGDKRRRPAMDPFAGYGEDESPVAAAMTPAKKTKSRKTSSTDSPSVQETPAGSIQGSPAPSSEKQKPKKKGKRKSTGAS